MQKDEAFVQGTREGKARTACTEANSGPKSECHSVARW